MRRLGRIVFAMALWLLPAAALPSVALAGPPAELRQDITSVGGKVTLGDLFYDAGDAAAVVAARAPLGQMVVLDATQVQILARSNGVDWGNPLGLRRIVVQAGAEASATAAESKSAAKAVAPRAPLVLAYLRNLNAGDVVQAEDLTWSREAVGGADAPRQPEAIIGMAARRPLREGEAASLHDVSAPMVIKKDDVIAVTFTVQGLSLTLQAKALDNAVAGQTLSVINTASKKIIQAVAVSPGQAVVGPEAEQIKAAARSSYSNLAQR
jgi:flagella basal body P-ring formation protein FlgA